MSPLSAVSPSTNRLVLRELEDAWGLLKAPVISSATSKNLDTVGNVTVEGGESIDEPLGVEAGDLGLGVVESTSDL